MQTDLIQSGRIVRGKRIWNEVSNQLESKFSIKKSAKQCSQHWFDILDPNIKKKLDNEDKKLILLLRFTLYKNHHSKIASLVNYYRNNEKKITSVHVKNFFISYNKNPKKVIKKLKKVEMTCDESLFFKNDWKVYEDQTLLKLTENNFSWDDVLFEFNKRGMIKTRNQCEKRLKELKENPQLYSLITENKKPANFKNPTGSSMNFCPFWKNGTGSFFDDLSPITNLEELDNPFTNS